MKKITSLLFTLGLMVSTLSVTAQYSVSMNSGDVYQASSLSDRFAGYPWGGVANYSFDNSTKTINLDITDYDETDPNVGDPLEVSFARVGFGNAPLDWGSDNKTVLATLTAGDFTDGAVNIDVTIPAGYGPVENTADYVAGYLYILQIVGTNADGETYLNYVVELTEDILSSNDFNKTKLSAFYNATRDVVVVNNQVEGDYSVYDLTGRRVLKGAVSNEISLSSLKSGLYILTTENGFLKFVK
ncbi:T9SS type A sorting domain-containing protein [uncultured Algibacter sp.]|uniref:T9SS type A sorting domain-containing protein n=1 Tax=uncultured Algibacter sp. TaxID=298659 RepID=UPI00260654B0|nr:T9SS type A sorting domain-containing protein [uncultured Algibacter sp.]